MLNMASDYDLDILAWTMLGEAGKEGRAGMNDVGHVILNRLNTGNYGSSIADVALSNKQFSTWNKGAGGNDPKGRYPKSSDAFKRARELAQQIVSGGTIGPPGRPLDYNASNVTPYWASAKDRYGTYTRNGHTFYPSVPVPPGELPEVATLTDTMRPRAPVPVTASPDMALMRYYAPPSNLVKDTFASLAKPQTTKQSQPRAADLLAMQPFNVAARLNQKGGVTDVADLALFGKNPDYRQIGSLPSMASPLASKVASAPPMPSKVAQSYAGQDRAPTSKPTITPYPAQQSSQLLAQRTTPAGMANVAELAAAAKRPTVSLPPVPSRPTVVASIPTTSPQLNIQQQASVYAQGGPTRKPTTPQPNISQLASIYAQGGPTQPKLSTAPDRLAPTPVIKAPPGSVTPQQVATIGVDINGNKAPLPYSRPAITTSQLASLYAGGGPTRPILPSPPTQVAQVPRVTAPVPMPASMRPVGVATQLSVTPPAPPRIAPVPLTRPNFGMGGPVPVAPRVQGVAPVPMPRLQRTGLAVGPVQIGGPIGMLTRAMANSSGPFNNGTDNLLYNAMRGGDFNTPGAATHVSSSGYLFAPGASGGPMVNVGRAVPGLTPAQLYALANEQKKKGGGGSTVEQRVAGSSGLSSSGASAYSLSS